MHRFFFACLVLIAVCVPAPVSAFVDRNDVTSAAQFSDYVPASYLKNAGITDSMTVEQALDAYITYALSFSSPTAYAYIAQLPSPSQVTINAGGNTASASRGDVVADGWKIVAANGASFAIRFPGGVTHTITGPYTYTVPAYGAWGSSATFGGSTTAATSVPIKTVTTTAATTVATNVPIKIVTTTVATTAATSVPAKTVTTTVATMSSTGTALPDTSGYAVIKKEINCRGTNNQQVQIVKLKGDVYAVHYSRDPKNPDYFMKKISASSTWIPVSDETTIIVGAGSFAGIEDGVDYVTIPEKSLFVMEPRIEECIFDVPITEMFSGGKPVWREKTIIDKVVYGFKGWLDKFTEDVFQIQTPTVTAGVRG